MSDNDEPSPRYAPPTHITIMTTTTTTPTSLTSLPTSTGGHRLTHKPPRGIYHPKGEPPTSGESTKQLLNTITTKLGYQFRDADLLHEALESPGSGVVCVGVSKRICEDGNRGLARVGDGVMRFVVEDCCYLYQYHWKEIEHKLKTLLHPSNLDRIGRERGIAAAIRPRAPLGEREKKNPIKQIMSAAESRKKAVAQGVRAVIGAIYFDGGFAEVRRVLGGLGLVPDGLVNGKVGEEGREGREMGDSESECGM